MIVLRQRQVSSPEIIASSHPAIQPSSHPQPCPRQAMSDDRDAQLPACQKCKLRKVRCDRRAPKCGNCTKGNIACIIVDQVTGEQYARDFIRQLEERERHLRNRLGEHLSPDDGNTDTPSVTVRSDQAERTPVGPPTEESAGSHSGFVGDGSGLG